MSRYRKIEECRICGGTALEKVLDLGNQYLTGIFPRMRDESITRGPVQLVKCTTPAGCRPSGRISRRRPR